MTFWTLPRLGREFYRVEIETIPQLTVWEISFDYGLTWAAMTYDPDDQTCSRLVAGPGFIPDVGDGSTYSVVNTSVTPYIRSVDNPEVIVRATPRIDLV